ncbi:MAG: type VII secretion target [Stackebrandtia sp.]
MTKEVRADPVEMATLGNNCTTVAGDLRDALSKAREQVTLSQSVLGNTTGVESFASFYGSVLETAGLAIEDLADVLEGDTDRIYRTAFSYKAQDDENARELERQRRPKGPQPSPTPGPSPTPPH